MKKQTVIDQIEIKRDGTVNIRIAKEIVDDHGTVLLSEWHRTVLPPGQDIDVQMMAVNDHLVQMRCEPVSGPDMERLRAHVSGK